MTSPQPRLSALVVVHNEERQLADCLSRLAFADEIVVVLDRCTDGSRGLASAVNAVLVEGAWEVEGQRRAAGQAACTSDWILEVDADERVTPELANEIRATITDPREADFFSVPFDNYIGQRLVRFGWGASFGVSAKTILFRRGLKNWGAQRVHPKVKTGGRKGPPLTQRMIHYVDQDLTDMLQRLNRYTSLNAADMVEADNLGTYRKNIARIFGRFWKCFVRRKGYREGGYGLMIAICAGLYPILSYLKAVELKERR